jgi:ABC-type multidrug transport system ATPase subunit
MIKICTVSKRYNKNSDLVLKNISFEISRGKVLGVLGPNGSGKTTLLKIIVGFLKATSGEILKI